MPDDKVGFGNPPKHSRFKPGQSGNPNGRRKRAPTPLAERIRQAMDAPMTYRERGQTKVAPGRIVSLQALLDRAARGDIGAAEMLLKIRLRAERIGDGSGRILRVENWLPDHPGQTADEKMEALRRGSHVEPSRSSKDQEE
jgi:hypothetical protein